LDDDIDMAVSHQHLISEFDETMHLDLMKNFGWGIQRVGGRGNIIQIVPGDRYHLAMSVRKTVFQIDIYAFTCNVVKGLVHFPWDNFHYDLNAFFPFERRDWMLPGSKVTNGTAVFGLPYDQECFLENSYGPDFRTPIRGKKIIHFIPNGMAVGQPPCKPRPMNEDQQQQFKRQLLLCEGCDASKANNQVLDDLANRSAVNSTVCIKKVP
jgi:hypothetical protein